MSTPSSKPQSASDGKAGKSSGGSHTHDHAGKEAHAKHTHLPGQCDHGHSHGSGAHEHSHDAGAAQGKGAGEKP